MYAVILAGGGGTRLHPLSRPERPKPFLPLLGERSLLQGTVERLAGLTDDVTVVTDRRYERLVREQAPDVALVVEPLGRNTAAAIALAVLTIDRPADEVMVVLPADQQLVQPFGDPGEGPLGRGPDVLRSDPWDESDSPTGIGHLDPQADDLLPELSGQRWIELKRQRHAAIMPRACLTDPAGWGVASEGGWQRPQAAGKVRKGGFEPPRH